jgi:hypothetical protein
MSLTNCKEIPVPKLEGVDIERVMYFYKLGNHLFAERYFNPKWKSFDLIHNSQTSPMMKHFPSIEKWSKSLKIGGIKTLYLSVLAPKSSIPWHVDKSDTVTFSSSMIAAIKTDNSFIEFKDDGKYTYKQGMSYLIKSGVEHRIFNLSEDFRVTVCVTPEVDSHVLKLVA